MEAVDGGLDAERARVEQGPGLVDFHRPEHVEHLAADADVLAGQGLERGGSEDALGLGDRVVVHQEHVRGAGHGSGLEDRPGEAAGPAEVPLLDDLELRPAAAARSSKVWWSLTREVPWLTTTIRSRASATSGSSRRARTLSSRYFSRLNVQ